MSTKALPYFSDKPARLSFSIEEFCQLVGISSQLFWKLSASERPATFTVGRRRLVSQAAAEGWVKQREAASAIDAAAT